MPTSEPDELLSTGQAALILGSTRRHVIDLCARGELPYTMIGTHRRVKRSDVTALADRSMNNLGGPMTRDQLRSLWLHRAVVAKIASDPLNVLTTAVDTLTVLLDRQPDGEQWLRQWLQVIGRGPEAVMRVLASTDPIARELRANSPFAGVLSPEERESVLRAFAATSGQL